MKDKIFGYLSPNLRLSLAEPKLIGTVFEAERIGKNVHLAATFSDGCVSYTFPTFDDIRPEIDFDGLIISALSRKVISDASDFRAINIRSTDDPVVRLFGDNVIRNFELCVKKWLDETVKKRLPKLRKSLQKASDEYDNLEFQYGDFVAIDTTYLNTPMTEFYRIAGFGFGSCQAGSRIFSDKNQTGVSAFFEPYFGRGRKGNGALRLFQTPAPNPRLVVYVKPVFSTRGPIEATHGRGRMVRPDKLRKSSEQEATKAFVDWTFSDLD